MNRMNGVMGVVVSSVAVLAVVIVGWFFFVSPQRSKADRIGVQADAAHSELLSDEQLIATAKRQSSGPAAAYFAPNASRMIVGPAIE